MYKLNIDVKYKQYDIVIQKGLFKNIGKNIKKIYNNKKIVVMTDHNVEDIYGDALRDSLEAEGFKVETIVVAAGESSKSLEVLQQVYTRLIDANVTRGDMIIAFGGGVIGDLCGFAAATYLRGVKFIQIPTTLLAQIDSSIGGKVAVNHSKGKNLIGSFYHPEIVLIDPELLKTLDDKFLYDGMAEVIKYGCIKDKNLFNNLLEYNSADELFRDIEKIIFTCCSIKKYVVESDERDIGMRMLLNFGHTLGHGIEKYYNYEKFTHGEAIAIGMYNITKRSEELGITSKGITDSIEKLLKNWRLPYKLPDVDKQQILNTIFLDKKSDADYINLILLKNIGDSIIKRVHKEEMIKYI
ncbi:3-dehydroquinate synthase [Brassicibacter mesophilus]|uniref:3-dehydroquinate synthase n=1 Tax=Brassicibacter mesophilus TaxID=745119 RepID=UPI003D2399CD